MELHCNYASQYNQQFVNFQFIEQNLLLMGKHFHKKYAILFFGGCKMVQTKIGKFIAGLRKENGMMQEQLGEKPGMANKTVFRWENGCDRPDFEA